jgi:putative Mg2+ transporter-C (MgtC) family protein
MEYLLELKTLGYIALAMILGAIIGFERELADKPAGMRTHMLVAGAAALLVLLGDLLVTHFAKDFNNELIRSDPIRVVEAIVTGVAFLGAGTIIRRGGRAVVQGLTTAATLLFTAAVGICVALHEVVLAIGAVALALLTLRLVYAVEHRLKRKAQEHST